MKAENFQRSAAPPVGIVAVVSMNTIWNRKSAKAARIVAGALEQESLPAEQADEVAAQREAELMVQAGVAAHGGDAPSDRDCWDRPCRRT